MSFFKFVRRVMKGLELEIEEHEAEFIKGE